MKREGKGLGLDMGLCELSRFAKISALEFSFL